MVYIENQEERKEKQRKLLKWSLIIFAILFIASVSLGFSPIGAEELNNAFFSIFIHDTSTKVSSPDVSVLIDNKAPSGKTLKAESADPVRIVIPKVGLDAAVLNPLSEDVSTLNSALLGGAVRYPGSGNLESDRNVLIFGHSSALPVIHNQNFKIFNGLKELGLGDEIDLLSKTRGYRYTVLSVRLARADEVRVTFSNDHELILSTCNSFGTKEDRYVVEANFAGSYDLN